MRSKRRMETLEKYFELLKQGGADLAMRIEAQSVKTAPWTVYRCQYGCNRYGQSHCCPPKTPSWKETREMIDSFQYGILFRCHEMAPVTPLAVEAARELFLDGYYKTIAFGSGPCKNARFAIPTIAISRARRCRPWRPAASTYSPRCGQTGWRSTRCGIQERYRTISALCWWNRAQGNDKKATAKMICTQFSGHQLKNKN